MSSATHPNQAHWDRFDRTLAFMAQTLDPSARLLDVGPDNVFASYMRSAGYLVENTGLVDLDDVPEAAAALSDGSVPDAVLAFEVLEHLVNPLSVLRASRSQVLFASVPTRLWFSKAYRNPSDPFDRHYHEFEPWQFDWLLEKAGFQVVRREHWTPRHTGFPIGIRPLLRRWTARWYIVEARRSLPKSFG